MIDLDTNSFSPEIHGQYFSKFMGVMFGMTLLMNGDAALLECSQANNRPSLEPGLYARIDAESPFWPKLHAILNEPLTRSVVEATMQRFVELGFPAKLAMKLRPGDSLVKLSA